MSGYCPDFVRRYGICIQDVSEDYGGRITAILYFPDINKVKYYTECMTCSYTFEEIPTEQQEYFETQTPHEFYECVSLMRDVECNERMLDENDIDYVVKSNMYTIYKDWYLNYYLTDKTLDWEQMYESVI